MLNDSVYLQRNVSITLTWSLLRKILLIFFHWKKNHFCMLQAQQGIFCFHVCAEMILSPILCMQVLLELSAGRVLTELRHWLSTTACRLEEQHAFLLFSCGFGCRRQLVRKCSYHWCRYNEKSSWSKAQYDTSHVYHLVGWYFINLTDPKKIDVCPGVRMPSP